MLGAIPAARARDLGVTVVRPGMTDILTATVVEGPVTIALVGDGDTDLDLYVYDPLGRLMGYDDDLTDRCLVRFQAYIPGRYTIRVVNRSNYVANRYAIAID